MKRILAIVGDYYHKYEWAQESLLKALQPYQDVKLVFTETGQLLEKLGEKPDAVVLFKEDRVNPNEKEVSTWMTNEISQSIVDYVENGGNWVAWHAGLASFPVEGSYTQMLRGYFLSHPEKHQSVRYVSSGENLIVSETINFNIMDEHYFVHVDEANTNVFLRSESVDGESIAGWYHKYGNGRVVCLTPAHNQEGLMNSEFLSVLGKCVHWVSE
ncbi:type 1 glutamine amidotransferase [Peribacillus deserti]|uniref:Type 1 glutamine amidotransferase n=1 Tax=Peribacillus deserti TaxID=673318 RepID=A0ABS2QHA4_9BACI|nr:ThuA domain-containing protein [Peribacillus deserti]MBM7691661.1 type 1 glutamine amidotransferase [Peribacillus deserti]